MVNALRRRSSAANCRSSASIRSIRSPGTTAAHIPADRLHRQNAFDAYLAIEVAPFVRNRTSWAQMGTTGCSFGGYHAINFALRHPDIVTYAVSMSGAFDIPKRFLDGYYNDDAYFHSPLDYLPSMQRRRGSWSGCGDNYCVLAVGNHDPLFDQNVKLAHVLGHKADPARAGRVGRLRARLALVAQMAREVLRAK